MEARDSGWSNRAFPLKFARDRDAYHAKLREQLARFEMALLDYCLTSNHVHLLVEAEERLEVSALMRSVAGEQTRRCGVFFLHSSELGAL